MNCISIGVFNYERKPLRITSEAKLSKIFWQNVSTSIESIEETFIFTLI